MNSKYWEPQFEASAQPYRVAATVSEREFLAEHLGEVSSTPHDIVDVYPGHRDGVDFAESVKRLWSNDDYRLIDVPRYKVVKRELPDWMDPSSYARDVSLRTAWKYWLGFGANPEWPGIYFLRLNGLGQFAELAAIRLLKTGIDGKFRSEFRQSLFEQLAAWVANPNPQYQSPFSRKQWDRLITKRLMYDAENIAVSIYRSR